MATHNINGWMVEIELVPENETCRAHIPLDQVKTLLSSLHEVRGTQFHSICPSMFEDDVNFVILLNADGMTPTEHITLVKSIIRAAINFYTMRTQQGSPIPSSDGMEASSGHHSRSSRIWNNVPPVVRKHH